VWSADRIAALNTVHMSIPSASTSSGSTGNTLPAWVVNASVTTGHETPWSRAACTIVRPASATAAPAASRNLVVNLDWAGTCAALVTI
jgi:hypothetical protein